LSAQESVEAALKLNRRFIGCENEEEFVELIRRRLSTTEMVSSSDAVHYRPSEQNQMRLFERKSQILLQKDEEAS
jgi:DNA modification methylase